MKVTFLNEPGEGTGVARSFYTALAEAILSNQKIPNLEGAQVRQNDIDIGRNRCSKIQQGSQ